MMKHYLDPAARKAVGTCPWSDCDCARAPSCILSAPESCVHLIQNRIDRCEHCVKLNGPCENTYLCFRDARDIQKRRHR